MASQWIGIKSQCLCRSDKFEYNRLKSRSDGIFLFTVKIATEIVSECLNHLRKNRNQKKCKLLHFFVVVFFILYQKVFKYCFMFIS